jgi:hypothetical protein
VIETMQIAVLPCSDFAQDWAVGRKTLMENQHS